MCKNRCYAKLPTQNKAILQKPQSVTGSPAQGIFKCKIRQCLLKCRPLSLAKIFKPSKGKFPSVKQFRITDTVRRLESQKNITRTVWSKNSHCWELRIFFPLLKFSMSSPHVVYLGSLRGIQGQNLLLIKVHFQLSSVQFLCPGPVPVSWISLQC